MCVPSRIAANHDRIVNSLDLGGCPPVLVLMLAESDTGIEQRTFRGWWAA